MVKHVVFGTILNVMIFASVIVGYYGYKGGNYFIPILCASAFGLSVFYKIKHTKSVREEMKQKAEMNVKQKNKRKK
ncbi:MAG: hypothetical protein KKE39_00290 [Bacteroidetes bacterium]|nr:hypothetical protein [Pseudopedobacter sp.]MBU0694952.1 hypothetical protein [Bacteroidota bacterium]MBU1373458.1 hypothetical protein [Bacteroidota bacterium]MBU1485216.1 hypothetical protein [Bacteroidota bacterium]MBU2045480.1 hypothetical protein [Bacteroidota bacterium]